MGIFDETAKGTNALNLFDGDSPLAKLGNAAINQGIGLAKAKMKSNQLPFLNAGLALAQGDLSGAVESVINPQLLHKLLGTSTRSRTSPLTAGLSLKEVQNIVLQSHAINHARKNLWLLNVSDYSPTGLLGSLGDGISKVVENTVGKYASGQFGQNLSQMAGKTTKMAISASPLTSFLNEMGGGITSNFNLLATNVNYTPFSIESENRNVGATIIDGVRSSQKAEITITTMDDEQGTIKKWFKAKASQAVHADGTVGVLTDSLIQIRILHAFVSDNTNMNGFEETIICRPVSVEYEFDRREDGLQEFAMRFEQTDTFIR